VLSALRFLEFDSAKLTDRQYAEAICQMEIKIRSGWAKKELGLLIRHAQALANLK
jgi:hypothetical protein